MPTTLIGQDNFQEVDVFSLTYGIVKHSYRVARVEELAEDIREAYAIAASGRPGPVLIDIPKDVQQKKTRFTPKPPVEIPKIAGEYTEKEIAQAVKLMEKAKRSLHLLRRRCDYGGCRGRNYGAFPQTGCADLS